MLFAAMLVNAGHAALEDAKEALDRVRVTVVSPSRRTYSSAPWLTASMRGKFLANRLVVLRFVRVHRAVQNDMLADDSLEGLDGQILDLDRNGATAALDHRQHFALGRRAALALPALAGNETSVGLADECFVNFDRLSLAAQAAPGRDRPSPRERDAP